MAIATLTVDFVAKVADLQRDFDKAAQIAQRNAAKIESAFNTIGTSLASLGVGLSVGAIVTSIKSMVSAFDDLDEAAQAAGVGAVALAELRTAASFAGVGAEKLDGALVKLNVKIADAAGGSKDAVAAFRAIGVAFRDDVTGNVRGTEEVLRDLADKFKGYSEGAEKSALAAEFFGLKNAKMVALLNGGADGLRRFSGLSAETVREAAKLQSEFDKLATNAERLKNAFASVLVPAINQTIDVMKHVDWKNFATAFALGPMGIFRQGELVLKAKKDLEEYNKAAEESQFLLGPPASAAGGGKKSAPVVTKDSIPKKEEISDASRELGSYIEKWQGLRDAIDEVSEQEKILRLLKERPEIDIPQVRQTMLLEAEKIDNLKAEAEARKEIARIQKESIDASKSLRNQLFEFSGINEENRKIALREELEKLLELSKEIEAAGGKPIFTKEQLDATVKGIGGIKDELSKVDDLSRGLGDSIKSAFGDAIVDGEKFGDVLKRLNDRILSMAADNLFEKAFGSFFSGKGGGGAEGLFGAFAGIFGGMAGGGGGGANPAPEIGESFFPTMNVTSLRPAASAGTTVVYNIAQVGSNVSRADMASAMEQTRAATIGQIQDLSARGRLQLG